MARMDGEDTSTALLAAIEEIETDGTSSDIDYEEQIPFYALEIPAAKGSIAMKLLTQRFGTMAEQGYGHLKRMKKHSTAPKTLVALVKTTVGSMGAVNLTQEQKDDVASQLDANITTVEVLKRPPRTRELFEMHTKQWPLVFHASVEPEPNVEPIEADEAVHIHRWMQQAVDYGKQLDAEQKDVFSICKCALGCLIVDPQHSASEGSLVGDSFSRRNSDAYALKEIYHPIMIAIDAVAHRDRVRDLGLSNTTPSGKRLREWETNEMASENVDGHRTTKEESYLCTGYDIYLDREPCIMCAMALVHSRARRVFFFKHNPVRGALQSVYHLHLIKSLNHHYRAFQVHLSSQS